MNERLVRITLRALAVLIAIAAVVDPALTGTRSAHPEVVVLASGVTGAADSALVQSVVRKLAGDFSVMRVPFANAAATVVVGTGAPPQAFAQPNPSRATPVFAVVRGDNASRAVITSVNAPARTPLNNRVAVAVAVQLSNAKGKTVEVELLVNDAVVDRVSAALPGDSSHKLFALSFIPTSATVTHLQVVARIAGSQETSTASRVVDVTDEKWPVLFYDSRPSWMSTFVRRALERDPRFVVTSRTVTSTNVSTDAGKPPVALNDASVINAFDAIVVGAPEALTDRDVDALNQFMRRRGGGVALLFDDKKSGRYESLTGTSGWLSATNATGTIVSGDNTDSVAMRATEWMWPSALPERARVLAWNMNAKAREHAMVWETSVGAGHLVVSSALDAWKFRDPSLSGFERFWQSSVGELAHQSQSAVEIVAPTYPVSAGSDVDVVVTSRRASLTPLGASSGVQSSASAFLQNGNARERIRLWPAGAPGVFHGLFRAPDSAASYRIIGIADDDSASATLVVAAHSTSPPAAVDTAVLSALTGATGGQLLRSNDLNRLPAALRSALNASPRRVSWHPMRSLWWLVPFALLLSGEWWLRRRRGLP